MQTPCRGNFQSTFVAFGRLTQPIAEILFNAINVHGYFMEYDIDRAGGFEPLRFVPKGKIVVLGLITSKSGGLKRETRSSVASMKRPNTLHSTSFAGRRNAVLPPLKRAISWLKTSSGRNCE